MEEMKTTPRTHCYLCGAPCEPVDAGRHIACEQEENARLAEWESDMLSGETASTSEEPHASKAA